MGHYTRDELSVGPKQREEERREDRKVCPLRWELRQQFPGYEVQQYNIIVDTLGGWSQEMNTTMKEIVGSRSKEVLNRIQKAVLSGTLNNARFLRR